jgi:DNA polymerase I-like protein with 3'-5' exonuclease and polymerase domains
MTSIVTLPNVRRLFIPDRGMVIADADLSGADAQVVAWEADDADLKRAFRAGMKIHIKNAEDIWGDDFRSLPGDVKSKSTPKGKRYDECKRGVHATNYGAAARTLSLNPEIRWPISTSEAFQRRWFNLHPGIRNWHNRVQFDLNKNRTTTNRFGYRIIWFDRIDSVFPNALAWGPQSTVAEVCFRGTLQLVDRFPWCELLLQVHDSIVFQFPSKYNEPEWIERINAALLVEVPFPNDPLVIPWGMSISEKSWGHCK